MQLLLRWKLIFERLIEIISRQGRHLEKNVILKIEVNMKKEKTFIVQIKDTESGTWQGTVQWVEKEKKEIFRSALELMKLMESAVESDN